MGFNIPYTDKKRVVIIGGGFGGLKLAEKLKKSKFQVVLIDKNNYHQLLWKQNDRGTVSTHENGRRGVSFTRHLIN